MRSRSSKHCKPTTVPREERKRVAGVNVTLSWPSKDASAPPKGVTFLLPGAMISISEYNGLRDVILEQHHLVVSLYVNVLWPLGNNHRKHAQDVKKVFDALISMYAQLPNSYSIVGHSVGGKIALLLASIIDPKRVSAVLSLDPVDLNPIEFSNEKGPNLPLDNDIDSNKYGSIGHLGIFSGDKHSDIVHVVKRREHNVAKEGEKEKRIPIILTCTDGGLGIPKTHDAEAIHNLHPATNCYHHAHAGHMAYCDNGGGLAGMLMPDVGTKEGNEKSREAAHNLIRQILGS
mmetsp:Transcript_12817/g.22516  ORF Transcript_12817/g.22516 Transcript_12817/m.22516 type:complete len:289 (+) Transcript_12817:42-908(+)|eukprot:CAMPEP_0201892282 /NCGR_PEP_ID=MMETSP0902-20130614/36132_1 /ASSEMBLY_ACC=CAM_ASM_000551 /TAXON_ID=420261 /ORGANISM="Thalassiosira antarctica, Strain CCMP982" /LENGTH=288 /DNA_ID=CAMNT_0048423703 /DNA_START=20 /DNA_END=886 /DNA_ORIENTATION=+